MKGWGQCLERPSVLWVSALNSLCCLSPEVFFRNSWRKNTRGNTASYQGHQFPSNSIGSLFLFFPPSSHLLFLPLLPSCIIQLGSLGSAVSSPAGFRTAPSSPAHVCVFYAAKSRLIDDHNSPPFVSLWNWHKLFIMMLVDPWQKSEDIRKKTFGY